MKVTRPKNEMTPFQWQPILDAWPREAANTQEAIYMIMADIIRVGLPLPVRYRGHVIADVPEDQVYYFVDLFLAQYKRAMKEILKRDREQAMEHVENLRKQTLKDMVEMREMAYIRQLEWERENAGKKPRLPELPPGFRYIDDEDDL